MNKAIAGIEKNFEEGRAGGREEDHMHLAVEWCPRSRVPGEANSAGTYGEAGKELFTDSIF